MLAAEGNGASVLTETLAAAGVRTVFSLSGNQIMPVYDACIDSGIRIVHVRHEAAAVAMADAHAQLTGEIGVALVTAAPGFANALSPLYSARAAESPVLLLSGDSPVEQDGNGAFQELQQNAVAAPLVKASLRPLKARDLAPMTAQAIRLSRSGRKGPVHMALPFDALNARDAQAFDGDALAFEPVPISMSDEDVRKIGELLDGAERPLVLLGPQFNESREMKRVKSLADALNAPAIAMESPRGLRDPSLGAFAEVVAEADLIILLGKTVDFTLGFLKQGVIAADADIVVIDPEHEAIDRARTLCGSRVRCSVRADVASAVDGLSSLSRAHKSPEWREVVAEAIAFRQRPQVETSDLHPIAVCDAVAAVLREADEPILICDGGEFGQWAQAFCNAPVRVINGPSGAIGNGLSYAIAAKLARPKATVIAMMGDGTAGFHLAEFETAAREDAAIIAVVGNDSCWNAEHQIQLRDFGPERLIGCTLSSRVRYDQAVEGLGCQGIYVERPKALSGALHEAVNGARPALVNVIMAGAPAPVFSRTDNAAPSAH
ncbi:thiamine pyrophosphate-binding protein [Chelativorans sp. YIM 93263]|uniref:thiamine pyrophosphate-binding protein n=1 Tax=Chelativorans sp. YIM 93263 TaxID=2906648 RepID=UPI002379B843|nr:thiamine pyrophosphate-binding protein [Chelativorans sp. YIM 93263]